MAISQGILISVVALVLLFTVCQSKSTGNGFQPKVSRRGQNQAGTEKWAYVDVRPDVHMFYWLYYTYHEAGYENRPWILWLQGGPGASSCGYGNFELIGPLDLNLNERTTTWVEQASVLFVDNPVGAGYSYVERLSDLTRDVEEITEDLLNVLRAVLEESPEFQRRPFYVFGQSYGGKMGAHFTRRLHDEILRGTISVQLMGFAMGNSWISPIDSTLTWAGLLYWMSLVDQEGHDAIMRSANLCEKAVNESRWTDATSLWTATEVAVSVRTNGVDFYNILKFTTPSATSTLKHSDFGQIYKKMYPSLAKATDPLDELMNGPIIREKLGIIPESVVWGAQSDAVFNRQAEDFMKPVVDVVDSALKSTTLQTIVYQGQLDLICDTKGTMDWVQQLTWNGLNGYNAAARRPFVRETDKQTEMYVKAYNRFKFYWVLYGGHSIAKDNGETALKMFTRIIENLDN